MAPDSTTETFAALRLEIDSWRWQGTPFYIRAGKCLPVTCTEIMLRFRKPPTSGLIPGLSSNYLRFRVSPEVTLGLGMMAKSLGDEMVGEQLEMQAARPARVEEMDACERVLTDAIAGDATLFARQDDVEEAWRIVDPLLAANTPVYEYQPGTWGPGEVDQKMAPPGGWHNPVAATARVEAAA